MPFGHGPRSCIGMRFAKLEAKIALANMVKNFELLPSKRTYSGASFIYPKNGHFIKAEKHENIEIACHFSLAILKPIITYYMYT